MSGTAVVEAGTRQPMLFLSPSSVFGLEYAYISSRTEKPGPPGLAHCRHHENGVIPSLSRDLCAALSTETDAPNHDERSLDKLGMTLLSVIRPCATMDAYPGTS